MARKTKMITICTCDLCGNECLETDGNIEVEDCE